MTETEKVKILLEMYIYIYIIYIYIYMEGGAREARGASAPLLFFPKLVFFIFSVFFLIDCKLLDGGKSLQSAYTHYDL